ncbi:MAG: DUF72 domain-containing protein [Planctomycetes bacterium]|nr:DUF72 domain-containing protein [Planctomycetota bacterium]
MQGRAENGIIGDMAGMKRARVWSGPAGWSYPDWDGVVYPARKERGFKPLAYIARFFNAVEVNSSFYHIPRERMTAAWIPLVPSDFRFALKLTRTFTHERDAFPPRATVDAFAEGVKPIREAGLLGPLLMQFPWSFRYTAGAVDWLRRLAEEFGEFERFVEVRHASWAQAEALECLRGVGGYCNIDQPRLRNCLGPSQHVFGRSAYVRLHGRNARMWFADDVPAFERYNYLYDEAELREWVTRLNALCAQAEDVYVFANNHYRGQGPANALELRALLEGRTVDVPEPLCETYPRLSAIAAAPREPGLFGPR